MINKSRLLNGWTTRTSKELDQTIRAWAEVFAIYHIPITAYQKLYERAFAVRQSKLSRGENVPSMDATLLVSCWTGENGLKAELEREQIAAGRSLPAHCDKCDGTGWESFTKDGYSYTRRCKHDG